MKKENPHKKTGNFKVPEGYFGDFEDRLLEKIATAKTLPREDGFRVPENYFGDVQERLFRKLPHKEPSKVIRLSAYKKISYTVAAAAAVFILFIGIKSFLPGPDDPISITSADVEAYIDNGYMALSSYDLAEVFEEETLDLTSITGNSIDTEKLVDYLYENLESYEDLATKN